MIDRLKRMKETLASCVEGQLGNLKDVDAKELGEVVDMVKDLEEAIYYCTITKSMEEADKKEKHTEHHYYTPMYYRDMDREYGRMYYPREEMYYPQGEMMYYQGQPRDSQGRFTDRKGYSGGSSGSSGGNSGGNSSNSGSNSSSNAGGSSRQYHETEFPIMLRDEREGRSPMSRKMYMESKEMHKDKATKIKDLENYTRELGEDIVEMIQDASLEEKQILEKKISGLATKIASLNNGPH